MRRPPFWTWFEGPRETAVVVDVPKMPPYGVINGVRSATGGPRITTGPMPLPAALARSLLRADYCEHAQAISALLEISAALDREVGDVFKRYSRSANCIVFWGHGMMAAYPPHTILDELLCRMGLTVRVRSGPASHSPGRSLVRAATEATPEPIRRLASRYVLPRGTLVTLCLAP